MINDRDLLEKRVLDILVKHRDVTFSDILSTMKMYATKYDSDELYETLMDIMEVFEDSGIIGVRYIFVDDENPLVRHYSSGLNRL